MALKLLANLETFHNCDAVLSSNICTSLITPQIVVCESCVSDSQNNIFHTFHNILCSSAARSPKKHFSVISETRRERGRHQRCCAPSVQTHRDAADDPGLPHQVHERVLHSDQDVCGHPVAAALLDVGAWGVRVVASRRGRSGRHGTVAHGTRTGTRLCR